MIKVMLGNDIQEKQKNYRLWKWEKQRKDPFTSLCCWEAEFGKE